MVQLSPSANTLLRGRTATRLTTQLFHRVPLRGPTAAKGTNPRVGTYRRDGRLEDAAGGPACLTVNLRGPGSLPHPATRGVDTRGVDSRGHSLSEGGNTAVTKAEDAHGTARLRGGNLR